MSIIFVLPTVRPVTGNTMNYAAAFLILILGFAAVYWLVQGRKFYTGPLIEAEVNENASQGAARSSSDELGRKNEDKVLA